MTTDRLIAGGKPAAAWVLAKLPPLTPEENQALEFIIDNKIQSDVKAAFAQAQINIMAEPGRTLYVKILAIVCPGCVTS